MVHHCCVPNCTSDSRMRKCVGLSYHAFPVDKSRQKEWIEKIRRDPGPLFNLNSGTKVCSRHFNESDYCISGIERLRKRLKSTAVPSIFEWTQKKKEKRKLVREPVAALSTRTGAPFFKKTGPQVVDDIRSDSEVSGYEFDTLQDTAVRASSVSEISDPELEYPAESEHPSVAQVGQKETFNLARFSDNDADIKYYTGFPSFQMFTCFYENLCPECQNLSFVGTENTSQSTEYELLQKRGMVRHLTPQEEFFITLVRLRKGLPEKVIADLYNTSEGHISIIVNTWILFLADRVRFLPVWPKRRQLKNIMPFFKKYKTTRVIVDCTEILVELSPASFSQRDIRYNTVKGLLGIAPTGQITYISRLFDGQWSNKKILRQCGLLNLLEEGDGVMIDKGFDCKEDLKLRGAHLIIPPFVKQQRQIDTQNAASLRVFVDKAMSRVKEFDILSSVVPVALSPMLEKIWFVCANLANFSGPVTINSKPTGGIV